MKDDKENKIDSYFRDGLENLTVFPPSDVWNHIADHLPQKKDNRKMFLWIAVAASVSLFAAFSGWNYLHKTTKSNNIESIQIVKNDNAQQQQQQIKHEGSKDDLRSVDKTINTPESGSTFASQESKSAKEAQANKDASQLAEKNSTKIASQINESDSQLNKKVDQLKINDSQSDKIVAQLEKKKPKSLVEEPASHKIGLQKNKKNEPSNKKEVIEPETSGLAQAVKAENDIPARSSLNNVFEQKSKSTENEYIALASPIEMNGFDTPGVYGKVSTGSSVAKVDPAPVYDNIYAYEDVDEAKEKINRWSIGGQMAPLYSYRNISEVNTPGISKSSMNEIEKGVITYSSGIIVDYEASPRLSFQTGVSYMKMGQEIENVSSFVENTSKQNSYLAYASNGRIAPPPSNSTGIIVATESDLYSQASVTSDNQNYAPGNLALSPADEETRNLEQSFEFIEVPFLAKYKIINRKFNLHLLGGLSTHVLVDNKTKIETDGNSTDYGKTSDIETFNYSSSVGFGVGYRLKNNLFLSIEPTFKYYINSFNSSSAVKLHPYAFGLYSGLSFKF